MSLYNTFDNYLLTGSAGPLRLYPPSQSLLWSSQATGVFRSQWRSAPFSTNQKRAEIFFDIYSGSDVQMTLRYLQSDANGVLYQEFYATYFFDSYQPHLELELIPDLISESHLDQFFPSLYQDLLTCMHEEIW